MKTKVAILGSGNIGTDLMMKVLRTSSVLEMAALVGFADIRILFDATSAKAHARHGEFARQRSKQMVDLTPAAAGPYVVPVVNMGANFDSPDVSMVSCGGQATIRSEEHTSELQSQSNLVC